MQYTPAQLPDDTGRSERKSFLNKRNKLLIVGAVLLLAFGYFGATAFQSALQFYVGVDEFVAQEERLTGEQVQVKGRLVADSFRRDGELSTVGRFVLEENGARLDAVHDGVLPDLFFNPHSEIVLSGSYDAGQGAFVANRVLVKCPSKYRALEVENPSAEPPYDTGSA